MPSPVTPDEHDRARLVAIATAGVLLAVLSAAKLAADGGPTWAALLVVGIAAAGWSAVRYLRA